MTSTPAQPDAEAMALTDTAGRRYWYDAEFSSRVKRAVAVAERGQPNDGFDRFDKQSLIMGAAIALHLTDREATS